MEAMTTTQYLRRELSSSTTEFMEMWRNLDSIDKEELKNMAKVEMEALGISVKPS